MKWKNTSLNKLLKRFSPPQSQQQNQDMEEQQETKKHLYQSLQKNIDEIKTTMGNSSDLVVREISIGLKGEIKACLAYTDGLVDIKVIQESIMESFLFELRKASLADDYPQQDNSLLKFLKENALSIGDVKDIKDFPSLYTSVLSGETVILVDGCDQGFAASTRGAEHRTITEPSVQTTIRGPKEGFSELLRLNTSLIRRKIKNPNLWLETRPVGKVTKTDCAIMYIKGIANDKVVEEVRTRLEKINIDSILESGYIEELIEDKTFTPFPTIYNTERPDSVAAGLLEGRVAILVDGTPFVLMVPALFVQFFQAPEDYFHRSDFGLIRSLRYLAFFITLLGPGLYIAITTFHQEMLPPSLIISLAAQREGIPFPAFVEALLMEVVFEILREAGVRMPRAVGQAISIVGALILGTVATEAGLISPAMLIVVASTGISSFIFPSFNISISFRILRFVMMALGASFGLYGIYLGLTALVLHLCSLRSFGVPYMAPFAPFNLVDQKDSIFRLPWWMMVTRPRLISQNNMTRNQTSMPQPDAQKSQGKKKGGNQ